MFGDKIKAIRKSKKYSQQKFADELGISRQYISLVEVNSASPSLDLLLKIRDKFEINTEYLFLNNSEHPMYAKYVTSSQEKELMLQISHYKHQLDILEIKYNILLNLYEGKKENETS